MMFREAWDRIPGQPRGRERWYDGLSLILLMWPAAGGMWLLGSTRLWGMAPGLLLSFAGSLLVCLRPFFFRDTPGWRVPPGFWIFAVLGAYIVLRVPGGAVPHAARWEALRWICLLAAAFAWTQQGGRAHRWKWLLGVLLVAAALNCLYALIQHAGGSTRVLWIERPEQYGLRASGTYRCPNHFANMIALLAPLALGLVFLPASGFPLRLIALYFLAVAAPVLYWTQSRSGWLGLAGGFATVWLLLAWRQSRRRLLLALVLLPLVAAAAGGLAWRTLPAVRTRIGAVLEDPDRASSARLDMWRDMPAMIRARPWLGFGGGSFVWTYPPYQRAVKGHLTWDFLHNEYLQMQVEYGAVGLGLLLLGLLWGAGGLGRAVLGARHPSSAVLLAGAAGGAIASLAHACFDFNFHIFPNPHALVWIGGVAWGVWNSQEQGLEILTGRRQRWRLFAAAAGAGACIWGAGLTLTGGLSYLWNLKGEFARARLDWPVAMEHYRQAIRWDRGNWQPHLGLGNLLATQARWYRDPDLAAEQAEKTRLADEAEVHFRRALALNPCEMAAEFGLARVRNARNDPEGALAHFRRAAAFQQRHIFYREQLGVQLRRMGRPQEALEVFRRNVADDVASDVSRLNIRTLERKSAREAAPPER